MSADVVTLAPLPLNEEIDTPYGIRLTMIARPNGTAILVQQTPDASNLPDFYLVSLCHRPPNASKDEYSPSFVITSPARQEKYEVALFDVDPSSVRIVFVVPVRHAGPVIGLHATSPLATEGVIGLG
jgi:hypothetical protein